MRNVHVVVPATASEKGAMTGDGAGSLGAALQS
jgi:hypothetical protein